MPDPPKLARLPGCLEYRESCMRRPKVLCSCLVNSRKISLFVQNSLNGFNNRTHVGFQAYPTNAYFASFVGELFRQMNGNHEDRNIGKEPGDLTCNINAILIRHL